MPTVELDIRQLADEGGTAPLAPITVTDAVLDENGDTLTDTLDTLKNGLADKLSKTLTFTATNKADFLKQILDTVVTYPVGQYVMGITRQSFYFCLVIVAVQSSSRAIIEVIPQVGNMNELWSGTYNNGTYTYSKVATTIFTAD